jgi:hypothetical protein
MDHEEVPGTSQTSQVDQNIEKVDNSRHVREDPSTPSPKQSKGFASRDVLQ